jgi:hypothetical protein
LLHVLVAVDGAVDGAVDVVVAAGLIHIHQGVVGELGEPGVGLLGGAVGENADGDGGKGAPSREGGGLDDVDDLVREADEGASAIEVVPVRDAALVSEGDVGEQGGDGPVVVNGALHRLVVEASDQVVQPLPAGRVILGAVPIHGPSIDSG